MSSFGAAMRNRRFRSVLIAISGLPIAASYLWSTLLQPLLVPGSQLTDFHEVYLSAAAAIKAGQDPYGTCQNVATCFTQLSNKSFYPPVVSWLLQPLVGTSPRFLDAAALIACHLFVLIFLVSVVIALRISDWQLISLCVMTTLSYPPLLHQIVHINAQVALLGLSGVWLLGWMRGDRWWGGMAAGLGVAVKLLQAPTLLLMAWRRRLRMLVTALAVWGALWVIAVPQYLPEYLFKVLPVVGGGTGYGQNVAPIGTVARILHPESMDTPALGTGVGTLERAVAVLIALCAVAVTAYFLGRSERSPDWWSLEAAVSVAVAPLISTLVWPGHLALLLLPIVVLIAYAFRSGDRRLLVLTALAWALTGPVYLGFTNAYAAGYLWLRPLEESALVGVVLLWGTVLVALRQRDRLVEVAAKAG